MNIYELITAIPETQRRHLTKAGFIPIGVETYIQIFEYHTSLCKKGMKASMAATKTADKMRVSESLVWKALGKMRREY